MSSNPKRLTKRPKKPEYGGNPSFGGHLVLPCLTQKRMSPSIFVKQHPAIDNDSIDGHEWRGA